MAQFLNKTVVFATLTVLVMTMGVQGQTSQNPERAQLLNGLTILYGNRPDDPNVLLKLRIKSGAAFDLTGKAGTMSLLADAMFPESTTREYVSEQLGGQLDVSTTYDAIDVTLSGKASELERMIDLLRNAVLNVNLSAESIATLRATRIKQLAEKSSNAELADRAVAARLFGSYPYGNPAQGTPETLAKIERADLMLARERFLNAENATLVVVGGVEKSRLMRALRQILGPWQKGDRIVPATFRQPGGVDDRVLVIDHPEAKQTEVRIGVRGFARSDRDRLAARALSGIAEARCRKAMPELSACVVLDNEYALQGIFVFAATVPSNSAGKAITAMKNIMKELAESGPSAEELRSAITLPLFNSRQYEYASQRQSPSYSLADAWLDAETYKLPPNAVSAAANLSPDDLRRAAGRLFANSAPLAVVVLGNAAELQTQLGYKIELRTNAPESKTPINPASSPKKP